ncbi:putative conserved domain containing protein [Naviculisporaceae sp. PSN 640]
MSSAYSPQYYTSSSALPIPSAKGQYSTYPTYYTSGDSTYSVSPPEDLDTSVTSGSSGLGGSGTMHSSAYYSVPASSSYAGSSHSQGEYDSAGSASGIDLNEYMSDRFAEGFDPIPLDKCTAVQAQTSGLLNAKQRELLELQAKAQARLAKTRARFAQGLDDAREVRADLEWTQKKVSSLKAKASKKHSKEYSKARARYPSPDSY